MLLTIFLSRRLRSEKRGLLRLRARQRAVKVLKGQFSDLTSARRAADEALFDKEGFVNLFECARILTDGRGNRTYADRPAFEFVDNRQQDLIIRIVEAVTVDVERFQSKV